MGRDRRHSIVANPTFSLTGVRVLAENFSGLRGTGVPASFLVFFV
jgi:hypothetical protein